MKFRHLNTKVLLAVTLSAVVLSVAAIFAVIIAAVPQKSPLLLTSENKNAIMPTVIGTVSDTGATVIPLPEKTTVVSSIQTTNTQASGRATTETATKAGTDSSTKSTTAPAKALKQLTGKSEILDFYRKAVNRITENGEAGYKIKAWQTLKSIDTGNAQADYIFKTVAQIYLTPENKAKEQYYSKGSEESRAAFPKCTMTDVSLIQDARCTTDGDNYQIKLVIKDEDTPRKNANHLGQITNSVLYWEEIYGVLQEIDMIESIDESKTHIYYDDLTVSCTITGDGRFVSMRHYSNADITAVGTVKFGKTYDICVKSQIYQCSNFYDFEY